jgi:SAM-dependent methyltransferase
LVAALTGTSIVRYHGIDLSAAALDLAAEALAVLSCPVTLNQVDYVEALRTWSEPVDVVWLGLSLHHLRTPEKLEVLGDIRKILGEGGLFLIYEDTSPDGEDRDSWLRRWDAQQPVWTAYTPHEWETITAHVHAGDFPETASGWVALGHEAGFAEVLEVFVAPSDLFRLFAMRPGTAAR